MGGIVQDGRHKPPPPLLLLGNDLVGLARHTHQVSIHLSAVGVTFRLWLQLVAVPLARFVQLQAAGLAVDLFVDGVQLLLQIVQSVPGKKRSRSLRGGAICIVLIYDKQFSLQ